MSDIDPVAGGTSPDDPVWYVSASGQQPQGPITFTGLRNLAAAGHLLAGDQVWREGMAQWASAGTISGLTLTPSPPQPNFPPYAQYSGGPLRADMGADPGMRWILPVGRSGWAIAAGYLGLFSVLGVVAPIAIIVSMVAISDIKSNPHKHGMGRAVFGLIMGILGTLLLLVFIIGFAAS